MTLSDAKRTAEMHRNHLSLGLFPRLGLRFMTRWHQTFLASPHAWGGVVVGPADDVVAMVLMTTDQHRYVSEALTTHRWALARAGSVGLLRDPRVMAHFLRTRGLRYWRRMRRPDHQRTTTFSARPERLGVIHAVVTDESARGRGCARALLEAAESHARSRGTAVLALITDYPAQTDDRSASVRAASRAQGAAGMYDHLGWQQKEVRTRDGHRVAEYRRLLGTAGGPDSTHESSTDGSLPR